VLEISSSVGALAFLVYYFGFLLFMVYLIVGGEVYESRIYQEKYAVLIKPFKNKNISQRLLPALYLFRKIFQSLIIAYLYDSPDIQQFLLALVQFLYWVYIFLRNPFKETIIKLFYTILESEMTLLNLLYFFAVHASS
jgi:hypothetical protein